MLNIFVPDNHHNARSWIVKILFHGFFDYKIYFSDISYYKIEDSSSHFYIKLDDFLIPSLYADPYIKLHFIRLPEAPPFPKGFDCLLLMPIDKLFTNTLIDVTEDFYHIKYDAFGMLFWSLSNWEEYHYRGPLDSFGRFASSNSIVGLGHTLEIPWVDYWSIFIRTTVSQQLGSCQLLDTTYRLNMTHDIDMPWEYNLDITLWFKKLLLLISNDRNLGKFFLFIFNTLRTNLGIIPDPFYTFDWIFEIARLEGHNNLFYIMSGGSSKYDPHYSLFTKKFSSLIGSIIQHGHKIGLHPSYFSSRYPTMFKHEKESLNIALLPFSIEAKDSRQHFLKYCPKTTHKYLSDLGFTSDSSIAFPDKPGFRLGTSQPFNMFDIASDHELPLTQIPLIVMDVTLDGYLHLNHFQFNETINLFKSRCREVSGTFTVLWHNNQLLQDPRYRNIYRALYF